MVKHHDQKWLGEENVYLAYTSIPLLIMEGGQDRKLGVGTNAEAVA